MPKCPKCDTVINTLECKRREVVTYKVKLGITGIDLLWSRIDSENIEGTDIYICPICGAIIAYNRNDALAFLRQK